jgi:hypothetical protein
VPTVTKRVEKRASRLNEDVEGTTTRSDAIDATPPCHDRRASLSLDAV